MLPYWWITNKEKLSDDVLVWLSVRSEVSGNGTKNQVGLGWKEKPRSGNKNPKQTFGVARTYSLYTQFQKSAFSDNTGWWSLSECHPVIMTSACVDGHIELEQQQQTCSSGLRRAKGTDRRTDRRTTNHFTDPAPHTMWAVQIMMTIVIVKISHIAYLFA